jgi:hypothetical protein
MMDEKTINDFREKLNQKLNEDRVNENETRRLMAFMMDAMDDIETFLRNGGRWSDVADTIEKTLGIRRNARQLTIIKYRCKQLKRKQTKE